MPRFRAPSSSSSERTTTRRGGGHPRFERSRWARPEPRCLLVDGDVELLPGPRLVETSGHVPGHQSVLLDLPESGPVLLAIDVVSMQGAFTPDRSASPLDDDEGGLRASTRKLLNVVERENAALTIFHHDGAQWAALKTSPAWYA